MRLFCWGKDGGIDSRVWGFWPIEIKSWFSVALLVFKDGSREAFHNHAFNAVSFVLWGRLVEETIDGTVNFYQTGWGNPLNIFSPIRTPWHVAHKVTSYGTTVVLTFRGPWRDEWKEYIPEVKTWLTLTHGRKAVAIDQSPDY